MATQAPRQLDLRKKAAQKDEAMRKKLEADLQKKRIVTPNQVQAAAATARKSNAAAVKGTLAALKPAPILTVPETATVTEACQLCATKKTDCALIMEGERLIGIMTSLDLTNRLVAEGLDPRTTIVRQVMTSNPTVSLESSTVESGMDLMISKKINHLPIVNAEGKAVGVVDFMKIFYEILTHAYRKASASDQLLSAMAGVETALGTDGANKGLVSWAETLRQKTALPDLQSILSTRTQAITVGPRVSVRDVAQLMRDNYVTAVCVMDEPVGGGGGRQAPKLSGIFTTKDIVLRVIAAGQDAARCSVVRVMTPQPDKINLSLGIYEAVKLMHAGSYFHLPVVEDDDRLVAMFDIQVLAEATQEQIRLATQAFTPPEAAQGPMWGRFFDSIGSKDPLSALPGNALLFGSPKDRNDQLPPEQGADVEYNSPDMDVHPGDSISVVESASIIDSAAAAQSKGTGAGAGTGTGSIQESAATSSSAPPPAPAPAAVVEDFDFKFATPSGRNYRLLARPDDYNGLKESISRILETDPMFEADHDNTSGIVPDSRDFRISYIDSDGDEVFISSDGNVLDAVKVARNASSERVMLGLHGGKSWTAPAEKTEKSALISEPSPQQPMTAESKSDTPVPSTSEPPQKVDTAEPVLEAPPRYTPTYELEGPPLDISKAHVPRDSPATPINAALKLKETVRHSPEKDRLLPPPQPAPTIVDEMKQPSSSAPRPTTPFKDAPKINLGPGPSKSPVVAPQTDERERRDEEKVEPDKVKALIAHFNHVFSDAHLYKRLLKVRGDGAQKLLDTFQTLLDTPNLAAVFRRNLLVATQRLSTDSALYPTCYTLQDIELIDKHPVAAGGFADIHKGRYFGQVVCLKIIRIYQSSEVHKFLKYFASEAILWGQLSHPNLLPTYGLYRYDKRVCLVCPWMNNGNINEYLHLHSDVNRTLLISDIARGIAYLHGHDIIHGDLKGANILVDGSGRACLSDFGISAVSDPSILHWSSHSLVGSKGGSTRWQAPELFDVDTDEVVHNTKASDIYAYGCIVYEVFSGNAPFAEIPRESAVIIKVRAGGHPTRPLPLSPPWKLWGLTEHIWSLMEGCWNTQPEKRPNIYSIISEHQFGSILDDRPRDVDDILSPANFRDTVGDRAALPSVSNIEAILDAVNMENETPLATPPLLAPGFEKLINMV